MLKTEIENIVKQILEENGIKVMTIVFPKFNIQSGLLHKPIVKIIAFTETGILKLVVKEESLEEPPEYLFKKLYLNLSVNSNLLTIEKLLDYLSIKNMPQRENQFYSNVPIEMKQHIAKIWGIIRKNTSQIIVMEDLSECININLIDKPTGWTLEHLKRAIIDLAYVHSYLIPLKAQLYTTNMINLHEINNYLGEFHFACTYGSGIDVNDIVYDFGKKFIDNIFVFDRELSCETLVIHNDFNIRNICIGNDMKTKIYDWEFIDIGNPMSDFIDLLVSLASDIITTSNIDDLLEVYIHHLSIKQYSLDYMKKSLYFSALKYAATRMNMYLLCYNKRKLDFIERMYYNLSKIILLYKNYGEG